MNERIVHAKPAPGGWRPGRGLVLCGWALGWALSPAAQAQAVPAPAASATCSALLQHRFDRLQDEKPQPLCQYAGRVVLVLNLPRSKDRGF